MVDLQDLPAAASDAADMPHVASPPPPSGATDPRREMIALLPDLRAFARMLARERAAADDLVQDTLVRALGSIGQFQAGSNLKAWLFTILRNVFYEQARRRRSERSMMDGVAPLAGDEAGGGPSQAEMMDLQRCLWALSPVLREALILVGAQGFGSEEAAAICGVPIATMKARVARGRAHVARHLGRAPL